MTISRFRRILRGHARSDHPSDPKIDRIWTSWLGGDEAAAGWLASVADELLVPAGTEVGGGRFAYVLLDADAGCRLVVRGVSPAVVDRPTRVLVFPERDLLDAVHRFPTLPDAWSASLTQCGEDRLRTWS